MTGFLVWTAIDQSKGGVKGFAQLLAVAAIAAAACAPAYLSKRRDGIAFGLSAGVIALFFASLFVEAYPLALPSTTNHAFDLTLAAASSSHYTQSVMTVVAVLFVPIVLAYQGWTYWVFRHRLGRDNFEGPLTPVAVIASLGHHGDGGPDGAGAEPTSTA